MAARSRKPDTVDWAAETEAKLLNAALPLAPELGWNRPLVVRAGLADLAAVDPAALKVRERIRRGVLARCDAALADEPAVRRWSGFLALPPNVPLALRLVWESADAIWRWAGDVATDENHYSKRAILAGILITTLGVRMQGGIEAEAAHLAASIDKVMAFEKWKAQFHPAEQARDIARALGRIRYGRG